MIEIVSENSILSTERYFHNYWKTYIRTPYKTITKVDAFQTSLKVIPFILFSRFYKLTLGWKKLKSSIDQLSTLYFHMLYTKKEDNTTRYGYF